MPGQQSENKIRWTREEYIRLAQALILRYPLRSYDSATSPADIDFTLQEFNIVQMRALPKERRRIIQKLGKLQRQLYDTLTGMDSSASAMMAELLPEPEPEPKTAPAPMSRRPRKRTNGSVILWSPDEYKQYALALHKQQPQLNCLQSPDLAGLTTTMMNRAAQTLPEGRRRHFPAIEKPRGYLLAIYATARAERDPLFYPFQRAPGPTALVEQPFTAATEIKPKPQAAPEPVAEPAPKVAAPPPVTTPGVAAAPHTKPGVVRWTDAEWIVIALELHRVYPLLGLPGRTELYGLLSSNDVAFAQRVLEPSRQRPNLKVVSFKSNFEGRLVAAFKSVKAGLAATPVTGTVAVELPAAPADIAPERTPITHQWTERMAAAEEGVDVVGAGMAANPYEAAFKPLVDLFGTQLAAVISAQVAAQVAAQIDAKLAPLMAQLAALTAPPAPAPSKFGAIFQADKLHAITTATATTSAPPAPATAPMPAKPYLVATAAPDYTTRHPSTLRANAPRIGILGNRNTYHAELEKDFPGVDFVCIDTPKKVDTVRNCDKVIAMIRWVSHASAHKIKDAAGERYVPLNGGLSDLKRQLAIWIAAGIIVPATAPAALAH